MRIKIYSCAKWEFSIPEYIEKKVVAAAAILNEYKSFNLTYAICSMNSFMKHFHVVSSNEKNILFFL